MKFPYKSLIIKLFKYNQFELSKDLPFLIVSRPISIYIFYPKVSFTINYFKCYKKFYTLTTFNPRKNINICLILIIIKKYNVKAERNITKKHIK